MHDDVDGRHNNGKDQQGEMGSTMMVTGGTTTRHGDGNAPHDDSDGQQDDRRHNDGTGQHSDGRHDDGKGSRAAGQQGKDTTMTTVGMMMRHDDGDARHDDGDR